MVLNQRHNYGELGANNSVNYIAFYLIRAGWRGVNNDIN